MVTVWNEFVEGANEVASRHRRRTRCFLNCFLVTLPLMAVSRFMTVHAAYSDFAWVRILLATLIILQLFRRAWLGPKTFVETRG